MSISRFIVLGASLTSLLAFHEDAAPARVRHIWQASDTIVKHASAPLHRGVAKLVPELTIGTADGAAEYAFARITEIVPARNGTVLILEVPSPGTPSLRQYDANGKYVRSIGRTGQGPGEFRGPGGLTQLPDGRILLLDGPGRLINVYSADGEYVDNWRLSNFLIGTGGAGRFRSDARGIIYLETSLLERGRPLDDRQRVIVRMRPNGSVIDTVRVPDVPELPSSSRSKTLVSGSSSSSVSMPMPYQPTSMWAWSPRGYAVTGVSNRYAIELRIPKTVGRGDGPPVNDVPVLWQPGDPVVSIRRTVNAVSVSRQERADQRAYVEARFNASPGTLSGPIPEIPDEKPPYKSIRTGDDGRIWVAISTPSERYDPPEPSTSSPPGGASIGAGRASGSGGLSPNTLRSSIRPVPWREPVIYDVFEPDGTYVGQVGVPFGTRIVNMNGDIVWGVTTDADEVPYATRFRIAWQ